MKKNYLLTYFKKIILLLFLCLSGFHGLAEPFSNTFENKIENKAGFTDNDPHFNNTSPGLLSLNYFDLSISAPPVIYVSTTNLGQIVRCSGSPSPLKSFIVSGNNLEEAILITAPIGYEISTQPSGTYSNSHYLFGSSFITFYVRLAETATGTPSGNITFTSANAIAKNIAITGIVNTSPVAIATPASQTICSGTTTNIDLTSNPGTTFSWTATTATGTVNGTSAGTGNTIEQILTGDGTTNYTITPTLNGCIGSPITVEITVVQKPEMNIVPTATTCSGGTSSLFLGSFSPGCTYTWTASAVGVTGFSDGAGPIITQTLVGQGVVTYIVTPTLNGCIGTPATIELTVNAPAFTTQPSNTAICAGNNTVFSVATKGGVQTYQWQVDKDGQGFTNLTDGTSYFGVHSAALTIIGATVSMSNYKYRVNTSFPCVTSLPSNSAILTVNQPPVITPLPANTYACQGVTKTLTGIVAGGIAYQWQYSTNGGVSFLNAVTSATHSGGSTTTLTISGVTTAMNNYQYRLLALGNCPPFSTSNATTLSVSNITVSSAQTPVSCNGGSNGVAAVGNVTGGTAPYSYLWSDGTTTASIVGNLKQGNHTCTITDANGCSLIKSFTIIEPPLLVLTQGTINHVSCNGGSNGTASVVVTGGTGSYTYDWNGTPTGDGTASISGLAAGTYTVTIRDANSCQKTLDFVITQPNSITINPIQVNISCNGESDGSATAIAIGGTGTLTYTWSPTGGSNATATGLGLGTYTCTVTDANTCSVSQSFTIIEPDILTATNTFTNVLCNGGSNGSATATAAGGTTPYTYSWSNGMTEATASGLIAGTYTVTVTDANACTTTATAVIAQPATLLSATITKVDVACNDGSNGSATVTAAGGTSPYTYSWSNGMAEATASGLIAGTYTVTVTDANACTTTATTVIPQPATPLSATITKVDVACNDGSNGSATVTAAGGTSPYTYSWSNGMTEATASGLIADTYTVTITDAKGCTATATAVIAQPATLLSATITKVDVACNGGSNGSATATAAGGTAPYTYSWSNGMAEATASGLIADTYTVTITDAKRCTTIATVVIAQPATPLSATITKVDAACNGGTNGSATATAAGGTAPYTYSWSNGMAEATASGLIADTYTVTITDAKGCTTTATVVIAQPATPLSATTTKVDAACNGGSNGSATATAVGGTSPYNYSWSNGMAVATASGLIADTYTVTITDAKGCTTTATAVIAQPATPLSATITKVDVACNGGSNGSATATAAGGTAPYTYSWSNGMAEATASGLIADTYTVTITDAKGCTTIATVVIAQPATPLSATTTKVDAACNDGSNGSATVTAAGGTSPYNYSWSNGMAGSTASELIADTYTVTITDAKGCTTIATVVIAQPATPLSATTTKVDAACNGGTNGSTTVTAVGGTSPYTYSWSNGMTEATASGLIADTYTVTITDAKGCTTTATVVIAQPATALSATTTKVDAACNGGTNGSTTVTAVGGTSPYTYSWSNGMTEATASGLIADTYTVTITDAKGCTTTATVVIAQPATPLSATTTKVDVACNGGLNGSATATAVGGTAPYTYLWSNGMAEATASGLIADTYTVTITDAKGCITTTTAVIAQPATALSATTTNVDVSCNGGTNGSATVTAVGGTAPYTYSWSNGMTEATASGLIADTYTVTITDAKGCSFTDNITIIEPLAIIITTNPENISIETNGNATYTINSTNTDTFQWQITTNGTDWTDVVDGGTEPTYSGTTTNTLNITDIPVAFDNYQYRVLLTNGINCVTLSTFALLSVNNDIEAVNDDFSAVVINEGTTGVAGDVTANDLLNNVAVNDTDFIISVVNDGGLTGVTIDVTGNLTVPATATLGTYTVTYLICEVADATNCSSAEAIVVVSPVSGTIDFSDIKMTVYPNPASTEVFVKITDFSIYNNLQASLYDLNGRVVKQNSVNSETFSIDVMQLESAVYILSITSDKGKTTKRIVVDKQQ
ncbi:T9SS type A sorting domain-containing protein [Flavobacterium cerinum]|uniref:T9SS type A sorting domain-containing protein n=1 Tax=Flavobacterium cerinum TaxID=2502784 RepID=A0A3S3RKA1_9FLAO|nr:T9SS type A sorting domain-containing protein [Flavobacterium cerinum]RWX01384.1 T9SS type A sorting domain-containing protein [Flavobacterium cerinum]